MIVKINFLICCLMLSFIFLNAQDKLSSDSNNKYYILTKIIITGNKKTKNYRIEREVQKKIGDTILKENIEKELTLIKSQVYNLRLFTEVVVKPIYNLQSVIIDIQVKERWYIFVLPELRIVDKSYQIWFNDFNADLKRTTYGISAKHYNYSGRGDVLRINLLTGFTKQYSLSYSNPASNKKQNEGYSIALGYSSSRQVAYKTNINNQLNFFPKTTAAAFNIPYARKGYFLAGNYTIRKGIRWSHSFGMGLSSQTYNKNIIDSNRYFLHQTITDTSRFQFDVNASVSYQNLDNILYPLKGSFFSAAISKRNLKFNNNNNFLALGLTYSHLVKVNKLFYFDTKISMVALLPGKQPYSSIVVAGDNNLPRGLQNYFIDGSAYFFNINTIKFKILDTKFDLPFKMKLKFLPNIPLKIFPLAHFDFGYVPSSGGRKNFFNDKFIYTAGVGADFLTFYDFVFGVRYSYNQRKEAAITFTSKTTL